MNTNASHYVIDVLSTDWWTINIALISSLFFILYYTKNKSESTKEKIGKFLGAVLLLNMVTGQLVDVVTGTWEVSNSLPLQLCSLSTLLAIVLMFTKNQWVYEFLICWSAGALHSFITPELTQGRTTYTFFEYTLSHGGIIIAGVYATTRLNYRPRPWSWLKVLAFTQLTLPTVGVLNFIIDSNYMYLREKPLANNPFLIGEWPYYIIGLQGAALLHFFLLSSFTNGLERKRNSPLLMRLRLNTIA